MLRMPCILAAPVLESNNIRVKARAGDRNAFGRARPWVSLDPRLEFFNSLSHKRTWEFQRYNYHPALIFALFGPPIQPPETLGEALSKSPESTDSARAAHSLDNPATLPVESGLPVRF